MRGLTARYVLRRLGIFVLTIWLASTIIFTVRRLMAGDPVAAMVGRLPIRSGRVENSAAMVEAGRDRFGLDDPVLVQYGKFLRSAVTFDVGYSLGFFPSTVNGLVADALPWTIGLLILATLISFVLGNLIGALLAWRRTPVLLRSVLPLTLAFTAIPFFMLGILLLYVFSFGLEWFPDGSAYERRMSPGFNWTFISSVIDHEVLPAMAIVGGSMGFWARITFARAR
jgi:peptide/nickel transport system permease protein